MLIMDFKKIGGKLLSIRKKAGLTQSEVAELAGLSDRTYADFERGTVNMRLDSILHICKALLITPDAIVTEENESLTEKEAEVMERLENCTQHEKKTVLQLISVYLDSLNPE